LKKIPFDLKLYLFAIALRVAFQWVWVSRDLVAVFPNDPYPVIALSWLGWVPDHPPAITWPPLYPAFLAVLFAIFRGCRNLVVPGIQCVLSGFSTLLLLLWGRRNGSELTARIAAIWMAIDPPLIFFAPQYQTETLYIFFLLLTFCILYRALDSEDADRRAFWTGIVAAFTSLCRGIFLGFSPWLALALVLMRRQRFVVFLALGWAVPISLWTIRNYHYYGEPIAVSSQAGWNMYEGFTLDLEALKTRPYEMSEELKARGISDPLEINRYFAKKTKLWVREHPREAAKIVVVKAFRFWRPWPFAPYSGRVRALVGTYYTLLLGLAAAGAWLRRRDRRLLPVYFYFAYLTVMHSFFFTSLRYRLPIEPFLCFLAAVALTELARGLKLGGAETGVH
jgi:4-amino-4-deoxy-L-arabinose transferase-like glycosyltransferase